MTSELKWLFNKATLNKEYEDCLELKFVGRLNYMMVMKAIKNNSWSNISEGGQGRNSFWNCFNNESEKLNYSIHFNTYSNVVEFTILKSK